MSTTFIIQFKKAVFLLLRTAFALVVLLAVCLYWLLLFVAFSPFLLLAIICGRNRADKTANSAIVVAEGHTGSDSNKHQFIFDRRHDVSKLFGCNTRNVQYRWEIFSSRLEAIAKAYPQPKVLDFGAGSLRDSYELTRLGFCVTSVDLDENLLKQYARSYDWNSLPCPPRLFSGSLEQLSEANGSERFNLAIAFDVIEHLEDPRSYCRQIHSLLQEQGLLFTIVPNKRSVFERYFRYTLAKQRKRGVALTPGVPHLQFKSPSEWEQLFADSGFKIVDHQMAIGFFVNDCWNGLLGLPLRVFVTPVLERWAMFMQIDFNGTSFEERFSPAWLMKQVDVLDNWSRKFLDYRFGWNLIVAERINVEA